jgi:SAM-dependent MidA family methyltransferase
MTPLAEILRDRIARAGPVLFHDFMEAALYDPQHGYYRRGKDPFGKQGDYYTAEQLQPVFGILIAALVRDLLGKDTTVVELGAGRGEMAAAFAGFDYVPVDVGSSFPERFAGVVFANEFFDALPIHLIVVREGIFRTMRVGWESERLVWVEGEPAAAQIDEYIGRYLAAWEEGDLLEVNLDALRWMERIATSMERGYLLSIDYGYTSRERIRFPRGTLMSYRKHTAYEDILADPGDRDITAHVCFSALEQHGARHGMKTVRFESLAQCLLRAGEADQFAAALAASTPAEEMQRRLQLKTLLFGMGETFRTLLQKR